MQVIVINSQKGGSGKSMLCKHLSVAAEQAGDGPVFLIDNDPQGTLTTWHERRAAERPSRVDIPFEGLEDGLNLLRSHGAAVVFIDTGSGRTEIAKELFKLADLVVFPIRPTEDDLGAAPVTVQNVKDVGTPFLFVLTQAEPHTLLTAQACAVLSKHGQVAETFVGMRPAAYGSRYPDGQTITEVQPKGKPAIEIGALWKDIKSCLHGNM